ncbi:sensor histidine kinase [Labrys monachus]|uniref:histidine kinase n=1 Tax=Labrys monachus TaxID=217067 RepID=A0ABU0F9L8_9HYPH|nr:sensor histidine kinase [Labrys monachus]MDQ0391317.1 two-component system sensor histidine kinase QseC [Labrys monachus]
MTSLRRRLFFLLLPATAAIWLCAVAWIYLGSRTQLEHVLDTRLQEAARMVHSLAGSGDMQAAPAASEGDDVGYARQLSCQIWSFDGRLVARSSGAPNESLAQDKEGFADRVVDHEMWRVYTIVDAAKGIRIAIGDRIGLRDRLVRDLVAGLVAPALLIIPLLGGLIWLSLGRGLKPLNDVAGEIVSRSGEDMRPVSGAHAPAEIRPLIAALNSLFGKVEATRRHEREITAFAAHELRTPLAGLKTQAQVALAARDTAVREGALRQILVSVDRTSRLVRQLLALAKLEAMPASQGEAAVNVGALLREVVAALPTPGRIDVEIDPALDDMVLRGSAECLHLVLRNLHENAVEHMRDPGRIRWRLLPDVGGLAVEDEGPGIPEPELGLVTRRFYRGHNRSPTGTGLGLTIAKMAAEKIHAGLELSNRGDRVGLRCSLTWSTSGSSIDKSSAAPATGPLPA